MDNYTTSLDFVGKTIVEVRHKPDSMGLYSDMLLVFSDGTEAQIGATKEGFLVSVLTTKVSDGAAPFAPPSCSELLSQIAKQFGLTFKQVGEAANLHLLITTDSMRRWSESSHMTEKDRLQYALGTSCWESWRQLSLPAQGNQGTSSCHQ